MRRFKFSSSRSSFHISFLDAEKFNLRFSDASEITEIADKLRWYRYQKDFVSVTRRTMRASTAVLTSIMREAGRDFYPKEHTEKLAELFECRWRICWMTITCFCCGVRGADQSHTPAARLTQKAYAAQLGVPLQKFKRWEQGNVQIFKSTWRSISNRHNHSSKRADRL